MGNTKQSIRFYVAKADVGVLLGELDEREASVLFARVFRQLRAVAADPMNANGAELQIDVAHVDPFREWLDRAGLRHARNGDPMKARAFARVRDSERDSER